MLVRVSTNHANMQLAYYHDYISIGCYLEEVIGVDQYDRNIMTNTLYINTMAVNSFNVIIKMIMASFCDV